MAPALSWLSGKIATARWFVNNQTVQLQHEIMDVTEIVKKAITSGSGFQCTNEVMGGNPCPSTIHKNHKKMLEITVLPPDCPVCERAGSLSRTKAVQILEACDVVIAAHGAVITTNTNDVFVKTLPNMYWKRVIVDECQFMLDRLDRMTAAGHASSLEQRLFTAILKLKRDIFFAVSGTPISGDLHKGLSNLIRMFNIDPFNRTKTKVLNAWWEHSIEKPFEKREFDAALRIVDM